MTENLINTIVELMGGSYWPVTKTALFILLTLGFLKAQAQEIQIIGFDGPPYSIVENGQISGIGPEILQDLAKEVGATVTYKVGANYQRTMKEIDRPNSFVSTLIRNPDRETQYQWIGKMAEDDSCFLTMKGKPQISSLEEAKKYKIGVYAYGASEVFLRKNGLSQIDSSVSRSASLHKLAKGRIDGYYASNNIVYYALLQAGLNPKDFTCGKAIDRVAYYIATSLKTDPKLVEKLKKSFEKYKEDQKLEKILKKYHVNEVVW